MRVTRPNQRFGRVSVCLRLVSGGNAFHLDLLAADGIAHRFDVIGAGIADDDLFGDGSGLRYDGLLRSLQYLDGRVGPVDVFDVVRIGDGAANDLRMFLVQGDLLFNRLLGNEETNARRALLD